MSLEIREYRSEDRDEWMRVHAVIMTISHAWNYCIQERPDYSGYDSTRLVALVDGKIVGLTDVQYDKAPGEFCFLKDSRGGYVLEFGRLPEYSGLGLGRKLIDAAIEDAGRKGYFRLEYWTQDRKAQRFYQRLGLKEIGRHYRFRVKPPQPVSDFLTQSSVGVEYLYCACTVEQWPLVKEQFDVLNRPPLEPHLCIGYETRF